MKRPLLILLSVFSLVCDSSFLASAESQKVLWVPVEGTVELGLSPFIKRAIQKADEEKYDLIVLEIDTFGGRIDAAIQIRDALLDAKTPTLTFINKRAISAGALISLATRQIYFAPGATMGAATPVQSGAEGAQDVSKKYVSYFRSEMGATAERNSWPKNLAEAMVQASEDIPGVINKNEVLTLTSESALKLKMATGIAESREDLLKQLQLQNAKIDEISENWAEKIVRFLTEPTVSGLLMSGGILGLILEFQAPGFGLPGIIGITCLALFFFGKFIVALAGWEEVLLLLLGFALIFVELFLMPGTFVFFIAGVVCIFLALFFAGISPNIPLDFQFPNVEQHLQSMLFAALSFFVGLVALYFVLAKSRRKAPLVLGDTLAHGGALPEAEMTERHHLRGKKGVALTTLAPSGKIEIEGRSYDAISSAPLIDRGESIEVIDVDEMKILVSKSKRNEG
jgi:membrane-bound serine protease (ClpP class)